MVTEVEGAGFQTNRHKMETDFCLSSSVREIITHVLFILSHSDLTAAGCHRLPVSIHLTRGYRCYTLLVKGEGPS